MKATLFAIVLGLLATPVAAQFGAPPPAADPNAPVPKLANGKPDLSGSWQTVGRGEGDTLVLDSIGFSDETWLGRGGFFHSDQMRVIEKFTRKGNEILYEVTVEDPEVLVKPWVMPARTLRLSTANTIIPERGSCGADNELKEVATQFRH